LAPTRRCRITSAISTRRPTPEARGGALERALSEWNKTVAAEVDQNDGPVQKKLESAKMKLAKEDSDNK
jgi:hypothetical protein